MKKPGSLVAGMAAALMLAAPDAYAEVDLSGVWVGRVHTHLKENYIRRNGVPRSDIATTREHYARHGDYLTVILVINDPVNLTEPVIRTSDYQLDPRAQIAPYPCDPVVEIVGQEAGYVPHYLPGQHPYRTEYADRYSLPHEAVLGGAETMYPEYMQKIRKTKP